MTSKPVTIIVSDLHMGGGHADPGDDFVYQNSQFTRFIQSQGETQEGKQGQLELIVNGDFLEFAQVNPEAYSLASSRYWCSESESVWKLVPILNGHADVFQALTDFQKQGNQVTLMAGNHDVDLYWGEVQDRLRKAAGPLVFELGEIWYDRYGGRLRIGHGHMLDPANSFHNWSNPVLLGDYGIKRLEMCPGTLFMVKFVNWLEKKYPFADNLHPVTALADILFKEDSFGLVTVGWVFSRFVARHPKATVTLAPALPIGKRLLEMTAHDSGFLEKVTALYRIARNEPKATAGEVKEELKTEDAMADFVIELLARVPPEQWLSVFDLAKPSTLGIAETPGATLSLIRSGRMDAKEACRKAAREQWGLGAQTVVVGHTHLPDCLEEDQSRYFNPGSWTRYVDSNALANLTMEELRNEENFPYQLNYVRVEGDESHLLRSDMICYEESTKTPAR